MFEPISVTLASVPILSGGFLFARNCGELAIPNYNKGQIWAAHVVLSGTRFANALLQIHLIHIAPAPIFAALGTLDQRMLCLMKVRARVPVL